jgi:hypothetical protein
MYKLDVTTELLSMEAMKGTATGKDLYKRLATTLE